MNIHCEGMHESNLQTTTWANTLIVDQWSWSIIIAMALLMLCSYHKGAPHAHHAGEPKAPGLKQRLKSNPTSSSWVSLRPDMYKGNKHWHCSGTHFKRQCIWSHENSQKIQIEFQIAWAGAESASRARPASNLKWLTQTPAEGAVQGADMKKVAASKCVSQMSSMASEVILKAEQSEWHGNVPPPWYCSPLRISIQKIPTCVLPCTSASLQWWYRHNSRWQ